MKYYKRSIVIVSIKHERKDQRKMAWVSSVINIMERCKAEHNRGIEGGTHMTQLELDEKENGPCSCNPRQKLDVESMRGGISASRVRCKYCDQECSSLP